MSYEELRAALCEEYGWLPSDVDDMEWDVIDSMARRGKPHNIPVRSMDDVHMARRNWRKMIRGFGR